MRIVTPFLATVADAIVSEVRRKDVNSDEEIRQIAREIMKLHGLSAFERFVVKYIISDELNVMGI